MHECDDEVEQQMEDEELEEEDEDDEEVEVEDEDGEEEQEEQEEQEVDDEDAMLDSIRFVHAASLQALMDMGFPENRARKALQINRGHVQMVRQCR